MAHITHGIDVSKWQGNIDWDALAVAHKAGDVDFVIMRAGYGYSTTDPRFEEYYKEAMSRGIPCGAYWYAYWGSGTPTQEAQAFLSVVGDRELAFGIWYDVEYESSITGLSKAERTANVKAALEALSASGRYVGLYASTDMINNRLNWNDLTAWDVWVAQYNSVCTCKMSYGIWQYTSSGSVDGISGRVDRDWANKDYPDFVTGALKTGNGAAAEAPGYGVEDATPPRETSVIKTSPMTRGDLVNALNLAVERNVYVVGSLEIGPSTEGDTTDFEALLKDLSVGYEKE